MVGLHERVAGLDIDLIVMVGHAQQARGRQLADGRRVGRLEQHLVLVIDRQIEDAHREIVAAGFRQAVRQQLAHADHGHDITVGLRGFVVLTVALHDRRDQQHTTRISRLDTHQVHRLRHRHAAMLIGPVERGTPQRLGQQVVTEGSAEFALSLAIQHRYVLIALAGRVQLAVGVELSQGEVAQAFVTHPTLERRTLVTGDPMGIGIRLGSQQQRLGVAVEFRSGHRIGIGEKPAQAVEALLLIFETLFDTAVTFTGQQLETLPQLMVKQVQRRPRQQSGEHSTDKQYQQRDQPGRGIFADNSQDLGAHGVQRHKTQTQNARCGEALWP
ncbi:hypothetical protein D3C87_1142770 [compost metagenome]